VRARLETEAEQAGLAAMHERLRRLDPEAAAAILPTNARRIVRALEVVELTGQPFTATLPTPRHWHAPTVQLGLDVPRTALDARVVARVDRMWEAGFVDEVRALADSGLASGPTAGRAVGYAQVLRYLAGEWSQDEAREATAAATRRLIRRQDQWFRKDPRVTWLDPDDDPASRATDLLAGHLVQLGPRTSVRSKP
jgi:tRNA dimethylallyltransferase